MSVSVVTSIALPHHTGNATAEQARDFARVLCYRMGLNRDEWLALVTSANVFARARDERGVIWSRHYPETLGNSRVHESRSFPRPVEICPALALNKMAQTMIWISALRGKTAKRGSLVCVAFAGAIVFGRVTRKNADGTLRVALDDGQKPFGRYHTGVYLGMTLCAVHADQCAVLDR